MSTYNLGRILSVYRGNYDNATTYKPLDLVYTDGGTYVAKQTVTGIAPTTDTNEYWQVVSKNITNEEIRELYTQDEATRNARLTAFIDEASQTLEDLEASLTASVNNAIAPIATTLTNITATVEAGETERNNKVDNLITETTNAFEQAESNRENTLTNAITTINNNDTVYKTQLQSSVNSWLNEKGVEFSEAQQERATEFNAQEASRAGRFSTQLNSQATAFNNQQTQQATDFTNSQNSRNTTFTASEQERANIFAQSEAQREADIEIIAQEAERVTNLEETKANKDGYYVEFTAGMAEQLLSPDGIVDSEPYLYRTSAGSTSISTGVAEIKSLYGNSIVWNQQTNLGKSVYYDCDYTQNLTKTFNFSGGIIAGHKYLATARVKTSEDINSAYFRISDVVNMSYNIYPQFEKDKETILYLNFSALYSSNGRFFQFQVYANGASKNYDFEISEFQFFDLSQMFGLGNEPTVEQFKQWFTKDYYPYNTGEIINVNVDGLKTVGFNQWDEEWRKGVYYTDDGKTFVNNNDYLSSTNYIKVFEGKEYYFKRPNSFRLFYYDNNYTFLGTTTYSYEIVRIIIPQGVKYIKFQLSYQGLYKNDICINLSWSGYRNGDYEPYQEHNINIPIKEIKDADNNVLFPNGLLSAGTVKDEVTSDKAVKRCNIGELKNVNWRRAFFGEYQYFYGKPSEQYTSNVDSNVTLNCNTYIHSNDSLPLNGYICFNSTYVGEGATFVVRDDSITSVAELKNKLVGDYTYSLKNPIEVEFKDTPQTFGEKLNLTYFVDDFGIEEFTTDTTGLVAPVAHQTKYLDNLVDKIRTINGNTATACITNAGVDNLISTLGNAIGFTITKTWDTTNKCWTFTATPNNTDNNL